MGLLTHSAPRKKQNSFLVHLQYTLYQLVGEKLVLPVSHGILSSMKIRIKKVDYAQALDLTVRLGDYLLPRPSGPLRGRQRDPT
jgi:hypothetical protein